MRNARRRGTILQSDYPFQQIISGIGFLIYSQILHEWLIFHFKTESEQNETKALKAF